MTAPGSIRYITHDKIDKVKWDACIDAAPNGLIYGYSWWLDRMAKHWDALVMNDYETVMPLTWNKKWGFYYLYQPFFTTSLGVFGKKASDISGFLNAVPAKFRFWDIDLNEGNTISHKDNTLRVNYKLPLNRPYEEIYKNYKRLAKRMLKRGASAHIQIIRNCPPSEIIDLYRKEYKIKHEGIPSEVYNHLLKCAQIAFQKKNAQTYIAQSSDGEILAFYLILLDTNYAYSLLGGSTQKGQKEGAFYLLTDAAIKDYSSSERIFRFEGSDIEGIAFFNKQFDPYITHYSHLRKNKLPWPFRLFK